MWNWLLTPAGRKQKQEKLDSVKKLQADLKNAAESPRLHGVNLNDFHYLGLTKISYVRNDQHTYARVFFFVHTSSGKRKFIVKAPTDYWKEKFDDHEWVITEAALWAANERELYQPIVDPSTYLKEYMLEKYNLTWDHEKTCWKTLDKYDAAVKQSKKELPTLAKSKGNVVKLDFSKKEDDQLA